MSSSILSKLIVSLEANSAALKTGLDEANRHLTGFSKKADAAAKNLLGAFAAKFTVTGISNLVREGAQAADAMGHLAKEIGVPIEELSRLNYAAASSSVGTEQLRNAFKDLGKSMTEAFAKDGDKSALFTELGVAVADANGKLRSSADVFTDLAERFSRIEDGAAKATLAQKVFGGVGMSLIPMLNEGRAGLERLGVEAERFGQVIDKEAATSANEFNSAMGRLEMQSRSLGLQLAKELTPTLASISNMMANVSADTGLAGDATRAIGAGFKALLTVGRSLLFVFEALGTILGGVASAAVEGLTGNFAGALESLDAIDGEIEKRVANTKATIEALWSGEEKSPLEKIAESAKEDAGVIAQAIEAVKKADEAAKKSAAERAAAMKRAADEQRSALDSLRKMAVDLSNDLWTWGGGELAELERRFEFGDLADTLKKAGDAGYELRDSILATKKVLIELNKEKERAAMLADADRQQMIALFEIDRAASKRQKTHDGATTDMGGIFGGATQAAQGFASFDAALAESTRLLRAAEGKRHEAEQAQWDGDHEVADEAERAAFILREMGEQAGGAADAFTAWARKGSAAGFMDAIEGSLGRVGSAIEGALQGFAAGGVFGAAISLMTDLLMSSEGFANVLGQLDGVFQILADLVGALVQPMAPLIAAIGMVVGALAESLAPLFGSLGMMLEPVTVLLVFLADVLQAFAPVLSVFFEAVTLVQGAIMIVTNPMMLFAWGLSQFVSVLGKVASIIIWAVRMIAEAWNGAVAVVQAILNTFVSAISFLIPDSLVSRLRGLVNSLDSLKVNTDAMKAAEKSLANITYDSLLARAKENVAIDKATAAAERMSEALSNAPNGFKIGLQRFLALAPRDSGPASLIGGGIDFSKIPHFAEGGVVDRATLAIIGEGGEREYVIPESKMGGGQSVVVNFYGVTDAREQWEKIKKLMQRDQLAQSGGIFPAAGRFAGAR